jgi:hypothetical protein
MLIILPWWNGGEKAFCVISSTSLALFISLISHTLELPLLTLIAMPCQSLSKIRVAAYSYQATDAYLARLFRCKDGVADSAVELTLERLRLLSMSRRCQVSGVRRY